jgi:hypothetical protein
MILLLVAGIGFVLAGLLAILFGVPVKEFSFGNTLILSGVVATGTGAILLGLYAAVRELKSMTGGVPVAAPATVSRAPAKLRLPASDDAEASEAAAGKEGFLFPRDQPAPKPAPQDGAPPLSGPDATTPAPWQQEAAARDRTRERGAVPPSEPALPAEPAVKPRRNLLFSSSSRKERERLAKADDPVSAGSGMTETPATADVVVRPAEPPPRTFDEAWPDSRADLGMRRPRPAPAPGDAGEALMTPERPATPAVDTPQVTVLKSGVVDGMAYSLYSDGSIEAQMPEGMMRFASIDELRSHLDQRP